MEHLVEQRQYLGAQPHPGEPRVVVVRIPRRRQSELGARCEFQFRVHPPRNGAEAEAAFHDALQQALHLYLINRGVLITPFHNMLLCSPETGPDEVQRLLGALDEGLGELLALPGARG